MRSYFCTFADTRMSVSLHRIKHEAEQFNLFNGIFCFDENHLDKTFKTKHPEVCPDVRGFGYWVWKPQIILQTLTKMDDGDVLLYADAGCHLNSKAIKRFIDYTNQVRINQSGFLVFCSPAMPERYYTKGDLLDYFSIRSDSKMTESGQIQATAFLMRKDKQTVEVINRWLQVMTEYPNLIDDSPSRSPNLSGFREHRHDQSVFSILMKSVHAQILPLNHIWSYTWLFMHNYPIWAVRNRGKQFKRRITLHGLAHDLLNTLK